MFAAARLRRGFPRCPSRRATWGLGHARALDDGQSKCDPQLAARWAGLEAFEALSHERPGDCFL
jgi:hypothetical protein